MSDSKVFIRIFLLFAVFTLSACTRMAPVNTPSTAFPGANQLATQGPASWWTIAFHMRWDFEQQPIWHMDALLAAQICAPALAAHAQTIQLWRFHRRAVHDAAGHRFALIIYSDAASAKALFDQMAHNPLLKEVQVTGLVRSLTISEVNQPPRPPIAQTSDNNWPAEIQVSWPWFIMGVSQTWLKLIEAVSADNPHQDGANLPLLLDYYQTINERVTTLWREQGQHAYLHHLNALFGYQPLVIRETNLKRF